MTAAADQRVYLHLGAPKTGTTHLQDVLWRNREALARNGVLYPGDRPEAHFHAAMDLQRTQFQEDWFDEKVPDAWTRLVAEARRWPGTVVISHELFCTTEPADIERALSDLAFAEVHLVCTARDVARQLPAVWQEDIKNRHVVSFAEFSAGVRDGSPSAHWLAELFWERQDLPRILEKWTRDIPPGRVHVVTVPPPEKPFDLLWRRFAELVGVEPERFDATGGPRNRSLGVAETDLIHRLNSALEDRIRWPDHDSVVKDQLAARIMGNRESRTPLESPVEDRPWLHERAERLVAALDGAGYHVVGDLEELVPTASGGSETHPDRPDEEEVLDVAVESLAGLVQRIAADEAEPEPAGPPVGVRQSLVHLCEQHVLLTRLHALYRSLRHAGTRLRTFSRSRSN